MRVNIYAEEMTDRVELIEKEIEGTKFRAVRFYLALPTSYCATPTGIRPMTGNGKGFLPEAIKQIQGPFVHHPGDDDSAAVTFWGKRDLRRVLQRAIDLLDERYGAPTDPSGESAS